VLTSSPSSHKKSFRDAGSRIFRQETDAQPGIISLLAARTPTAVRELPLEKVVPNPSQPRMTWHEETLQELAASIKEHGVLQPILVRPSGDQYEIIAGERRWRSSKIAGKETIPAIVERFDDATALEIALIENLQREDLSPLDEAVIYKKMTDELGYSIRQLAGKLGKDKGYVENRLRLASAPDDVGALGGLRHSRRCERSACGGGRWQGVAGRREGGQDRSRRSRLWRPLRAARRDASLCLHSDRAQGPHARRASRFHRRKDRLYCPFPDARHDNACAKVWTVQIDARFRVAGRAASARLFLSSSPLGMTRSNSARSRALLRKVSDARYSGLRCTFTPFLKKIDEGAKPCRQMPLARIIETKAWKRRCPLIEHPFELLGLQGVEHVPFP